MNRFFLCFILIVTFLILRSSFFFKPLFAQTGKTIVVCPTGTPSQNGCDYIGTAGIQSAIDAANNGDTVLIKNGIYNNVNVAMGYTDLHGVSHPAKQYLTLKGESQQTVLNGSNGCGDYPIVLVANSSNVTIAALTLQNNCSDVTGIYNNSKNITINNNIILNSKQIGIFVVQASTVAIVNNTINNIDREYSGQQGNGIDCQGSGTLCTVKNDLSTNNEVVGISGDVKGVFASLVYNDSFNNSMANYNAFSNWPPATNLHVRPLYVNAAGRDFHLQAGSPVRNTGDPSILNPDGSRSDMGAYGGPGACGLDPNLPGCTVVTATPTPIPSITITSTPTPTVTPGGPTLTPTPSVNPSCICKSDDSCDASCTFDTYSDVTYNNPIKCSRETSIVGPTPNPITKTSYCQRYERTKGDVDGDGAVTNLDYFYYVSAVNGGGIPLNVDSDVNGDGKVSPSDRAIITRSLGL